MICQPLDEIKLNFELLFRNRVGVDENTKKITQLPVHESRMLNL